MEPVGIRVLVHVVAEIPTTLALRLSGKEPERGANGALYLRDGRTVLLGICNLGAEYPSPKKANLSIMVGLYKPR